MSNIEFLIHEVQHEGEFTRISGIVNKGKVLLNAEFLSVRGESGMTIAVALRVSNIIAYRRSIAELPAGMSGELHVSGQGLDELGKHRMLTD